MQGLNFVVPSNISFLLLVNEICFIAFHPWNFQTVHFLSLQLVAVTKTVTWLMELRLELLWLFQMLTDGGKLSLLVLLWRNMKGRFYGYGFFPPNMLLLVFHPALFFFVIGVAWSNVIDGSFSFFQWWWGRGRGWQWNRVQWDWWCGHGVKGAVAGGRINYDDTTSSTQCHAIWISSSHINTFVTATDGRDHRQFEPLKLHVPGTVPSTRCVLWALFFLLYCIFFTKFSLCKQHLSTSCYVNTLFLF